MTEEEVGTEPFFAPIAAHTVDRYALLLPLAAVAVIAMAVMRARPKFGMLVWLLVMCFVPVWLGFTVKVYIYPATAAAAIVLVGVWPWRNIRVGLVDVVIAVMFVGCLVPLFVGGYTRTTIFVAVSRWLAAYLVGRCLPARINLSWTFRCMTVVFAIVSIGAVIELVFHFNPFVEITASNSLYQSWGTIQMRGGLPRAEGAFGHSIALGTSIAMALPMVLASRLPLKVRLPVTGLMVVAVVATFSRAAMLCAVLALVLSTVFMKEALSRRSRQALLAVGVVVGAVLIPLVSDTFAAAGSEATNSADYRGALTALIPDFSVLGFSSSATITPSGELFFGRFNSVDSQLILTGLTYGWAVLLIGLGLLTVAAVVVLRGRATAPTVSVVAALPSLATVAFITQYTMMFWFVAGLAVYSQTRSRGIASLDVSGTELSVPRNRSTVPYPQCCEYMPAADLHARPAASSPNREGGERGC